MAAGIKSIDVIKYEKEAVEASRVMENATMNADIAKANMVMVLFFLKEFILYKGERKGKDDCKDKYR